MHLFTVDIRNVVAPYGILPGIRLHREPFPHINGVTGMTKIPLHADFAAELAEGVERRLISYANLHRYPDGTLLLPSVSPLLLTQPIQGDQRALVRLLVKDSKVSVDGGNLLVRPCPERGKGDVSQSYVCPQCREKAVRSGSSSYLFAAFDQLFPRWYHPERGSVKIWEGLNILVEGVARGGSGSCREYLIVLQPGQCIRFVSSRGWFRPEAERFLFWSGTHLQEGNASMIFSPGQVSLDDAKPL